MKSNKYRDISPNATDEEVTKTFVEDVAAVADELPVQEYKVRSTIPKLRIRTAPYSTAEALDSISIGQSVTIVEEKNGWGKTKFSGWVNLKYTERV